jgi:hypothetical protein
MRVADRKDVCKERENGDLGDPKKIMLEFEAMRGYIFWPCPE